MRRSYQQFSDNIANVRAIAALYGYLKHQLRLPSDLSDLLRGEWVYSISALDKLIHELVRIGMIDAFEGRRPATAKFAAFTISTDTLVNIQSGPVPPPSHWFEQEIIQRHKSLSFQDPDKISDGLSLIWVEQHKWNAIANIMGLPEKDVKIKLKNIVGRRNLIVHEADMDPLTGTKMPADEADTNDMVDFVFNLGTTIFTLVSGTAP